MAISSIFFRVLLLLLTISDLFVQNHGQNFGINYGRIANNLPSPSHVSVLLKSLNVSRIKLYDANPNVLSSFSNSNVEFIIGLGNELLQTMRDPSKAQIWIQQNVQPYISTTKITSINVGNEILGSNDVGNMINLLPAMQSVYNALVTLGLSQQVTVTTAHSYNILSNSFPPSNGAFRQDLIQYIQPLLSFQAQIKSPFFINAYPFFAYKDDPDHVSLNYVLFQQNPGSIDPNTNLHYDNMLYAQIDAVYAAIKALGHTDIEVKISETDFVHQFYHLHTSILGVCLGAFKIVMRKRSKPRNFKRTILCKKDLLKGDKRSRSLYFESKFCTFCTHTLELFILSSY
uniref:glucan endo-1,3-beta-D-glucosidase n=1 Tax=Cicer arietinum TaxID=3827 RepID=A0A3Q7XLB7_CICAR|nr:glucan endo-1,3-beta-glucosidase 14 isoform X2 [Cicer arietinum]